MKKQRSPEKHAKSKTPDSKTLDPVQVPLPAHYKRIVNDLHILDETLSIFRAKNQVPFFPLIKDNIERVSGRRFTIDNFRQLMTASEGKLFMPEWVDQKDEEGRTVRQELAVRAIHDSKEIFKRMTAEQANERHKLVTEYLTKRLSDYLAEDKENVPEDSFPVKPSDLPDKPSHQSGCVTPGRNRIMARCDSVASNGSVLHTPKSSVRRQLSVSASPIIPSSLPLMVTPVKIKPDSNTPPMSAKDKMEAIRNRVKVRETKDIEEAQQYDKEMDEKAQIDAFDMCIALLIKLNHKFPRGITTARMSTLKKDYGSMFGDPGDIEKWARRISELVPENFEVGKIGEEQVLTLKTPGVKFSEIKKKLDIQKIQLQTKFRE